MFVLQLEDVQVETLGAGGRWRGARGAGARAGAGAGAGGWGAPWLLRWARGGVRALYAAPAPPRLTDYRRALSSLLQVRWPYTNPYIRELYQFEKPP